MLYAMSSMDSSPLWLGEKAAVKSKHKKCQDITTEIYKRINITFAIKNLESKEDSDAASDVIDSNELSNGTDLFAYEKTDSLSSSVTMDDCFKSPLRKVINLNNNEETLKKPRQRPRRAKKRFRKRVKKKHARLTSDTDCSSEDEPLSRIVVDCKKRSEAKRIKVDKRTCKVKTVAKAIPELNDSAKLKKNTKVNSAYKDIHRDKNPDLLEASSNDTDSVAGLINTRGHTQGDKTYKECRNNSETAAKPNPVEEALSEQMAKEYEYFSKVIEDVGGGSDLDAVLMPALYPEVDLYERRLGLPRDVTYYTFADLVGAGPSTSQPKLLTSEFTKVLNKDPSTSETRTGHHTDEPEVNLVKKSSESADTPSKSAENQAATEVLDLSRAFVSLESSTSLDLESTRNLSSTSKDLKLDTGDSEKKREGDSEPVGLPARANNGIRKRPKKVPARVECGLCKLTFSSQRGLRRHLKNRCKGRAASVQPGETKVFACGQCAYSGASAAGLRRHLTRHGQTMLERRRPSACRADCAYNCTVCNKSFTRSDAWKRHQRTHAKAVRAAE